MKPDDVRVMSPFVGGAFGSGLRPQYQVVLAVLAARALKRSVRLVLTRQQMYALGYRPGDDRAARARRERRRHARRDHARGDRRDLAIRGLLTATTPAGRACSTSAPTRNTRTSSRGSIVPTPCDMRAPGAATGVYALECAMDELAVALEARSARAAAALLFRSRPERGHALHQQAAARMLPPGRGSVRLGQAQPRAALDARRQRAGRLGHGDRRLGSAADADRGPHRADRQRPRRSRLRDLRHRHRHLHDHGAGRGRHARPADRQRHASSSAIRRCRNRRSKAARGSRPRSSQRDRDDGRRRSARSC